MRDAGQSSPLKASGSPVLAGGGGPASCLLCGSHQPGVPALTGWAALQHPFQPPLGAQLGF
jgi:hypothetical protein